MAQQNVTTPRGEYGFDNMTVTLVFENGLRHTMRSMDTITYGNNVKRGQLMGTQPAPVANAGAKAEPACKIGGVGREEYGEIRKKQGPGHYDQEVQVLVKYKRGTKKPILDEVVGWQCIDAETSGKHGDPVTKGLEGNCTKCIEDGIDPFAVEEK